MQAFIIRRFVSSIFVLFIVTLVTFFSLNILPGDIASRILGPEPDPDQVEALRERLNLNDPLHERYIDWITNAVQGDFGLFRRAEVVAESDQLRMDLAKLQVQVARMENLTLRLSDEYLDLDLLDEQARSVLGLLRPDEIVIR